MGNGSWSDLPFLTLAIFDEERELLGYYKERLTGNSLDLRVLLPAKAASIIAVIAGEIPKSLVL